MILFCKTHCHSPLVQWRHLLTSLAALKLENICTLRRLHLLYILCSCTHSTSNVSGTTRGSGDTAVKKADTNPCPHGTHSVAMTNPITGMIWHGSCKAIQLMIYIYMQVQNISHPTEAVWGMFTTKFLSGLAKRWLTHTRYGQNASTKHMYWSKKIENNQMHIWCLIATRRMRFCLSLHHLEPRGRSEQEYTCPMQPFSGGATNTIWD